MTEMSEEDHKYRAEYEPRTKVEKHPCRECGGLLPSIGHLYHLACHFGTHCICGANEEL